MEDLLDINKYTDIILINRDGKILFSDVGSVEVSEKGREQPERDSILKRFSPALLKNIRCSWQLRQEKLFPDTKKRC